MRDWIDVACVFRLVSGARSSATSCETMPCTSMPLPMPGDEMGMVVQPFTRWTQHTRMNALCASQDARNGGRCEHPRREYPPRSSEGIEPRDTAEPALPGRWCALQAAAAPEALPLRAVQACAGRLGAAALSPLEGVARSAAGVLPISGGGPARSAAPGWPGPPWRYRPA